MEANIKHGLILKSLGGFYYIDTEDGIIETRARGVFRNDSIKPLVGDKCKIRITKEDSTMGYIEEISDRKNEFVRPPVSNVDQVILVFSAANPDPNYRLIDKFLIQCECNGIETILCINKIDLNLKEALNLKRIYKKAGYDVVLTSSTMPETIDELKTKVLKDKISVFAGPSGVGKSTLLNSIEEGLNLKTGEISQKLNRGKHTTRHVELFKLSSGGWVVDTAGFSSLNLEGINKENLKEFFIEFEKFGNCRFSDCNHYKEPACKVKEAVENGEISIERYKTYIELLEIMISGGII